MSRSFLIVLPKLNSVGARAGGQRHFDLGYRGRVEARAQRRQQGEHLRRGIGLHRIEDARVGQRLGEGAVIVAHDVEIDDEAWANVAAFKTARAQKFLNTIGHRGIPQRRARARPRQEIGFGGQQTSFARARWRRDERRKSAILKIDAARYVARPRSGDAP